MEQELYKARSLSSCIKTAYDITLNNAKTIIRKTWIAAITNAAIASLIPMVFSQTPIGLSLTVIVTILAIVANAMLFSKIMTLLNGKEPKLNFKRMLSMSVMMSLCAIFTISILLSAFYATARWAISTGSTTPTSYANIAMGTLAIVFGAAWLPASYSCMNFLYGENNKLESIFGKPYLTGFKSWGFLFMVHLMLGIIMVILYIPIFAIPNTLAIADMANAASMSLGDADGLPAGFMALYYISTFVAWLLLSYVCLWGHIAVYFAYGSITYKQANNNTQQTTIHSKHKP